MYTLGLPERPYAEVGRVSASAIMWTENTPSPLAALQQVAAERGCDGVIVMGPHDKFVLSSNGQELASGEMSVASEVRIVRGASLADYHDFRATYRGTCIVHI